MRTFLLPMAVVAGVVALTLWAMQVPQPRPEPSLAASQIDDLQATVDEVNAALRRLWSEEPAASGEIPADDLPWIAPAARADDLTILRRLSLALHGTIPSLEEIRRFQADTRPGRLVHWTAAMLNDNRFHEYCAERLARAYVGVEDGEFLLFRRDRFKAWLTKQLQRRRPYNEIVASMIAARGVWTGAGEVNFLTGAVANDVFDANKLAARTSRAFLGQRLDCAQCHDHPFDHWKQSEFEGLAAHFGQLDVSLAGVVDNQQNEFTVLAADGETKRTVSPAVPYSPEWIEAGQSPREQLAMWVTHPDNRRFERAIANRVWGMLFGRPFAHRVRVFTRNWETDDSEWAWTDKAIDDLPDPDDPRFGRQLELLDILGRDFRQHDCDLRRLITVIAASDAFQLESVHPFTADVDLAALSEADRDEAQLQVDQLQARWAVFPLIRLRPEQVIGSMLQASHVETIDQNSHLFVRAARFFNERDFINEFGDPGVDELENRTGTIQQALLRMNGELARNLSAEQLLAAPGQIRRYSTSPENRLDNIFLSALTRQPNEMEQTCFLPQLQPGPDRPAGAIQDLYWAIFNSPEFSWNH
ncbi:MAG: DUF1549 domain-containing protein [Planctomycetaceae bacterium]